MYSNEDYSKETAEIRSRAQRLEEGWLAEQPAERGSIRARFPSPIRPHQPYWPDTPPAGTTIPDYPPCPRCASNQFSKEKVLDGVRHNGDGYGARFDICGVCGWTVWWLYDEA